MTDFPDWVREQIETRGWSVPETARRSKRGGYKGISSSMIYQVINHQARPGMRFFRGMARAFDMSQDEIMRLAGELPALPDTGGDWEDRLFDLMTRLSPVERLRVIEFARFIEAASQEK